MLAGILLVGVAVFFRGQANSVKLQHICGMNVPWYDALFLHPVDDRSGCKRFKQYSVGDQ
jgi:hypothetical protein